jgi:hypothetical protein
MLSHVALIALLVGPLSAVTYIGRENQLHVTIPRVAADASIDGALIEPVWQQAAPALTGISSTRITGVAQITVSSDIISFPA